MNSPRSLSSPPARRVGTGPQLGGRFLLSRGGEITLGAIGFGIAVASVFLLAS